MKKIMTGSVILAVVTLFIFAGLGFADDSLYVKSNGDVGIGTSSPESKLHVATGEVRLEREEGEDPTIFNGTDGKNFIRGITETSARLGVKMTPAATVDLDVKGYGRAFSFISWSDEKIKKDINPIENSLDSLSKLRGVSYQLINEPEKEGRVHMGVIAQELEQEFPGLVFTDEKGNKGVIYEGLTALLIESVKQLETEKKSDKLRIKALEDENKAFEKRIADLEKAASEKK